MNTAKSNFNGLIGQPATVDVIDNYQTAASNNNVAAVRNAIRAAISAAAQKTTVSVLPNGETKIFTLEDVGWTTEDDYSDLFYYEAASNQYYPVKAYYGAVAPSQDVSGMSLDDIVSYSQTGTLYFYGQNGEKYTVVPLYGPLYRAATGVKLDQNLIPKSYDTSQTAIELWIHTYNNYSVTDYYVTDPDDGQMYRVQVATNGELADNEDFADYRAYFYYLKGDIDPRVDLSTSGFKCGASGNTYDYYYGSDTTRHVITFAGLASVNYRRWAPGPIFNGNMWTTLGSGNYGYTPDVTFYKKIGDDLCIGYKIVDENGGEVDRWYTQYEGTTVPVTLSYESGSGGVGVYKLTYIKNGQEIVFDETNGVNPSAGSVIYHGPLYTVDLGTSGAMDGEKTLSGSPESGYTLNIDSWSNGTFDGTTDPVPAGGSGSGSSSEQTVTVTAKKPLDIVLVVDQSGSMAYQDMDKVTPEKMTAVGKTSYTADEIADGSYYVKVGESYYPVYLEEGRLYRESDAPVANWTFGWGNDGISVAVNGAPIYYNVKTDRYVKVNGEMHRIFVITAGLSLYYGMYPYIYNSATDVYTAKKIWTNNAYWVAIFSPWSGEKVRKDSTWNTLTNGGVTDGARVSYIDRNGTVLGATDTDFKNSQMTYSWITLASPMRNVYVVANTGYTRMYYTDESGVRHYVGSARCEEADTFNLGEGETLYTFKSGTSRLDALQYAVRSFVASVEANQNAEDGLNAVTHRLAIVGFAGNKIPANTTIDGAKAVGTNGTLDYVNTGLFQGSSFTNYQTLKKTLSTTASTKYINKHYYLQNSIGTPGSSASQPVIYNGNQWVQIYGRSAVANNAKFYVPEYASTLEDDGGSIYASAFNDLSTDEGKQAVQDSIDSFAAYGGTYMSYGMAMANRIFANNSIRTEDVVVSKTTNNGAVTYGEPVQVEAKRIVVVFTDGEPGGSGYETAIANETLAGAAQSKSEYGADVYTIGLYKGNVSSQIKAFMKQLSSEYTAELQPVYAGSDFAASSSFKLDGDATYYYQKDGKFYSVTASEFGEDSLGWWEHYPDGSYSKLIVKGANGGTGTDYLYSGNQRIYGEDANKNAVYKSARGNDVMYEYRWFDADQSIVEPLVDANDPVTARRVQFYEIANQTRDNSGAAYNATASDRDSLIQVFGQVFESITSTTTTSSSDDSEYSLENYAIGPQPIYHDGTNTVVKDVISNDFNVTSASSMAIQIVDSNGNVTNTIANNIPLNADLDTSVSGTDYHYTWNADTKTVTVQGFDFTANAGKRLRVAFSNLQPATNIGTLYSNVQAQSGIYSTDGDKLFTYENPWVKFGPYTVTWMSGEQVLDSNHNLGYGDVPEYLGSEPTKDEDDSYVYTFAGWSTDPNGPVNVTAFPAVTEDATYYAVFNAVSKSQPYTVHWMNGGTEITATTLNAGQYPSDANVTYTVPDGQYFVGWSKVQSSTAENDLYLGDQTVNELDAADGNPDHNVYLYLVTMTPTPEQTVTEENVVVSYSTRNLISNEVYDYNVDVETVTREIDEDDNTRSVTSNIPMENGGKFLLEKTRAAATGAFYFMPTLEKNADNIYDLTPLAGISRAYYYTRENCTGIHRVTVVPGSSVYLDDSLQELKPDQVTAEGKPITYDYNAVLEGENLGSGSTTDIEKSTTLQFKFTGKRIDLYCTTEETSGTVRASVMSSDGTTVLKSVTMNNTAIDERFNVPTVSFTMEENGTYILQIRTIGATYKLDGVRVYQTYADDSVYAQEDQNANYINLREKLVNGLKAMIDAYNVAVAAHEEDETNPMPDPLSAVAFFNDDSKTEPKDYITSGPKNEIYLAKDEAVAFQIAGFSTYQTAPKVMVGLSVQNSTPGSVKINGETQDVKAVTDAYYTVNMTKTGTTGYVVIENKGTARIAITNLLISGVSDSEIAYANTQDAQNAIALSVEANSAVEEAVEPKLIVTPKLMSFVQNPEYEAVEVNPTPEPSAEPTYQPSIQEMIRQLLSAFVSNLFKSISRLFGN